jgi:hypothetical protein
MPDKVVAVEKQNFREDDYSYPEVAIRHEPLLAASRVHCSYYYGPGRKWGQLPF